MESHELGLGNLARYAQQIRAPGNDLIVEGYRVVIPSTVEPGDYPLHIRLQSPLPAWVEESPPAGSSIELKPVSIVEETDR